MSVNIIGLDLSLTATGVVVTNIVTGTPSIGTIKPRNLGIPRLGEIRSMLVELLTMHRPVVAVIEGYSFGSPNKAQVLGELGGVVRLLLHDRRIAFADVAPTTLKKFAVGKGNAGKDLVFSAAVKREPRIKDNNAADAWWLFSMGAARYDPLQVPRSLTIGTTRLEQLDRVAWPEIKGRNS